MAESIEIQMLERIKKAGRAVLFLNFYICRQCPFDKLDREDIYLYLPYRKQVTPTGLKNCFFSKNMLLRWSKYGTDRSQRFLEKLDWKCKFVLGLSINIS
jgi:hypothetical protein